jgi:hypothetical protein
MQLSDGQLDHIVASLNGSGPSVNAPPPQDQAESRRREPRVGLAARVTLIPLTDTMPPAPFDVALRDLSAGGVGFLHTSRIGLDEQFVALLPDGRDFVAVLCQVTHYQPLGEQLFAVGARFVRILRQSATDVDARAALSPTRLAS